jgi:hypothetical protein
MAPTRGISFSFELLPEGSDVGLQAAIRRRDAHMALVGIGRRLGRCDPTLLGGSEYCHISIPAGRRLDRFEEALRMIPQLAQLLFPFGVGSRFEFFGDR